MIKGWSPIRTYRRKVKGKKAKQTFQTKAGVFGEFADYIQAEKECLRLRKIYTDSSFGVKAIF